jgi:hypothetical protein
MTDDPRLEELARFTPGATLTPGYGDHYLFFVGRDDVHGILHYLIPLENLSFKLNMFGYDDDELNKDIMDLFKDPNVHVQISLDRSQAGGVHERKIIALDEQTNAADMASSLCILQSKTDQISHTKGGVCAGLGIGFEGSTNWSTSGEGVGISLTPGINSIKGFKAQNNTLLVSTNPVFLSRFTAQLDVEHQIGLAQAAKRREKKQ